MSETDPMNVNERRKYLHKMWGRYRKADKSEKTRLLDEIEAVTGLHRKSIIRTLNGRLSRKRRTKQRGKEYGTDVEDAIRVIARSLDYPCAERLQPNLVWMAQQLRVHGALRLQPMTLEKLGRVSISTVKRILKRVGRSDLKIARQKPKQPASPGLRKPYPMGRIAWDIAEAGHLEVDLVHHCGDSASGEYIHGLQMVDVASGWCEIVPIFGRSFRAMTDGFDYLLARLPFPVIELHPDNGSEFFNHFLLRYLRKKLPHLLLSRSRPYHKNDNRFVEENNHSLLRAYLGHSRFDTLAHLQVLRPLAPNALKVGVRQVVLDARPLLRVGLAGPDFQRLLVVEDGLLQVLRPISLRVLIQGIGQFTLQGSPQGQILLAGEYSEGALAQFDFARHFGKSV